MDLQDVLQRFHAHGIKPSAQRMAIAAYVLDTHAHPTADDVWREVKHALPMVSRATVYNSLNLLVEKKLLRQFVLDDGRTVFDAHMDHHHHLIDDETGEIHDVAWNEVRVSDLAALGDYDVRDYMVIMRGRKRRSPTRE